MTTDGDMAGKGRLSYAWIILAVSFLTISTTVTLRFGIGFFFNPIETEFGWGRTTLSTAVAINMIVYGLLQPIAGRLADRLGPKWVIVPSVALIGAGFGLMSQITSVWGLYLLFGVLVGAGLAGAAFVTQSALVGGWFVRRRTLALGIALSGASAGTVVVVPAIVVLILSTGWRSSALLIGVAMLLVVVPLNLVLLRNGPRADRVGASASGAGPALLDLSLGQALRTRPFWLLTGAFSVCGLSITMLSSHLPGHVTQIGLSPTVAATALSILGVASVSGAVLTGLLASRIEPRLLLGAAYLVRSLSVVILLQAREPVHLYLFAVVAGIGWVATVPLTSTLTASAFGRSSMGTILGFVSLGHQVGDAAGVLLGGILYDLNGSYELPFSIVAVALLFAATLSFFVDERATARLRVCPT